MMCSNRGLGSTLEIGKKMCYEPSEDQEVLM